MQFPDFVKTMLQTLESAGFSAYAVGGCVRDSLLEKTPADWDITTSARPEETVAVFSRPPFTVRTDNGLRHGTVTVILEGNASEITTYRTEGSYTDHRRPDQVTFVTNIEEDLSRRDFTVNAMAAAPSPEGVKIVDPFGGRSDLAAGILRAVGDASRRFDEDALRILRGMRFAARYGFCVEADTALAMHERAHLLKKIAPERIGTELSGLLAAACPASVLSAFADIAELLFPGVAVDTAALARAANPDVRLALLLSALPEEEIREHLLRYAFGLKTAERVARFVSLKEADLTSHKTHCQIADTFGEDGVSAYFAFRRCLSPDDGGIVAAEAAVSALFTSGACYNLTTLAVTGRDLLAAGIPAGPALGLTLHRLLDAVIAGEIQNDRDALIRAARSL